ncbi:NAD(P)H-hydrate dehydratase [Neorhizobium sp. T786]|uniref:NAD(P)H-hydrate dehydratase n=1 Tax=Pseudorhizobium xiangyangii TaxID=2883104 RepID=UPI001CFF66A3|nr:NAD(P)H-hydrate dehydratase [Neorhizobium xiangyangii]MCB5202017.1 NAD(P)H-hydrate dehydratase [Neorhizobium xiangyangii]
MIFNPETILLTPDEMAAADATAALSGIDSFGLMEKAGQAVAAAALRLYPQTLRFVVLCGPGNNGGDGYVAARALANAGCRISIHALGESAKLAGDARRAFECCALAPRPLAQFEPQEGDTIIDAVFGAGLTRDVPADLQEVIAKVVGAGLPVIAVDLPSGLCGRRGVPLGAAFKAHHTVTFMAKKPGHILIPGRSLCGDIEVCDIGIPARIVQASASKLALNHPSLWRSLLPSPDTASHKYRRGHLAVFSGSGSHTGAARLSAAAGLAAGAGLVTLASPADAMAVNAGHLTAVMLRQVDKPDDLRAWISTAKLSAFVLGPGFGIGEKAREFVSALEGRPLVLDADGITSFRDDRDSLFETYRRDEPYLVLTPHDGEFARLFPVVAEDDGLSKVEKALAAAWDANAIIVYKGSDTVIAAPDGRALINANAPPWLATAGSGDVLAGMIGTLLANGMPSFEAAAAGVYLHGEAALRAGSGMTAEDLVRHIAPLDLD